jgi:hypothetical protein
MVRQRSRESRPPSLCTKPTLATKGSMMWIFCSGVTISSCRFSCWNRRSPYWADSSEPRPKASSITTKRNERERTAPHSSPNW